MIRVAFASIAGLTLGACALQVEGRVNDSAASARIATQEALVDDTGQCPAGLSIDPSLFRDPPQDGLLGLTECELVALQGPPTSVQIGASPLHKREVMLLYSDSTTGKTIYLFADNKLIRIVR